MIFSSQSCLHALSSDVSLSLSAEVAALAATGVRKRANIPSHRAYLRRDQLSHDNATLGFSFANHPRIPLFNNHTSLAIHVFLIPIIPSVLSSSPILNLRPFKCRICLSHRILAISSLKCNACSVSLFAVEFR